jgi:hypothetical protein
MDATAWHFIQLDNVQLACNRFYSAFLTDAPGKEATAMDWDVIASSRIDDITKPKSSGRPANLHVVRSRATSSPDYERMRELVHQRPSTLKELVPSS